MPKSCALLKIAKHSFADMKECNLKKTTIYQKWGVVCQNAKRCFIWPVFLFFFFYLCVFVLLFCTKGLKGYFLAILDLFFFLFCSPKMPVFKILLFFLFSFSFFPFCFPFQNSIFALLFVHQPLLETLLILLSLVFICLAFSFPNVCLFLWNKLS